MSNYDHPNVRFHLTPLMLPDKPQSLVSRSSLLSPVAVLTCSLTLLASATSILAQAPGTASTAAVDTSQIERSRLPNPTMPLSASSLVLGEPATSTDSGGQNMAPSSSGDNDLGVQSLLKQSAPKPQPWSIFADVGFVNTTNVALTKRDTFDDTFAVTEIGVGYEWQIRPDLAMSLAVREQYFAYNRFDDLDFGAFNFGVGLTYSVPKNLLGSGVSLSAQLGFTRLTRQGFDDEFYRSGTLGLGLQKLIPIGRAQLLSFGGDVLLGLSFPHTPQREEFGLSAGYVAQITRHLSLSAGLRAAYYDYAIIDRSDFNLSLSTGATYAFTSWCSLGATVSGSLNRSDHSVFDYNVLNSGGSVFFRLKF